MIWGNECNVCGLRAYENISYLVSLQIGSLLIEDSVVLCSACRARAGDLGFDDIMTGLSDAISRPEDGEEGPRDEK